MTNLTKHLMSILGKRALVSFGVVTFLVAALLATVNITSRYAIKSYVEDQLERIPWDVAIYQTGGVGPAEELASEVASFEELKQVESLVFLRFIG